MLIAHPSRAGRSVGLASLLLASALVACDDETNAMVPPGSTGGPVFGDNSGPPGMPGTTTGMPGTTTGTPGTTTGTPGTTTGSTGGMGDAGPTTGMMSDGGMAPVDGGMMSDGGMMPMDGGMMSDGGMSDGGTSDGALTDGMVDAGMSDGALTDGMLVDGMLPEAGTDAEAGADTGDDSGMPGWATREDQGEGDGSDVITMGDSWMDNSLFTGGAVSGALGRAGKDYRNYAVQGTTMTQDNLFGAAIPSQFDEALDDDPDIATVIMTGGGNDVLLETGLQEDCRNGGDDCAEMLAAVADRLAELWADMAEAGVEDVVYIAYASDAGDSGPDAANTELNGVAEKCRQAPLYCHILDSPTVTEIVQGDFTDGIHPTRAANNRLAEAILELMEERQVRR